MLEEGQIRIGWSTNDADLILGTDARGLGYGTDDSGEKLTRVCLLIDADCQGYGVKAD